MIKRFIYSLFIIQLIGSLLAAEVTEAPIRVACIGDSITEGHGVELGRAYPAQLQEMLGDKWLVRNFGLSGRTLLRKGDAPYWNEAAFQQAQEFQPNVVIIMLGTNDTKPFNWEHEAEFSQDYADMVEVFRGLDSHPKVYVCLPCPVFEPGMGGINEADIQILIPRIKAIAEEKQLGLIDMHEALVSHPELLPDSVHPNTEGATVMAQTVFEALTAPASSAPPKQIL